MEALERIGVGWFATCILGGLAAIVGGLVVEHVPFWLQWSLVGGGALAVLIGFSGIALDTRAWLSRRARLRAASKPPSVAEPTLPCVEAPLRAEAATLALDIEDIIADHRRTDPLRVAPWSGLRMDASESAKRKASQKQTTALLDHNTETMNRYARLRGRTLALFDRLHACGLIDVEHRFAFEYPTNPLGMEEVAGILGAIGSGSTKPPSVMSPRRPGRDGG